MRTNTLRNKVFQLSKGSWCSVTTSWLNTRRVCSQTSRNKAYVYRCWKTSGSVHLAVLTCTPPLWMSWNEAPVPMPWTPCHGLHATDGEGIHCWRHTPGHRENTQTSQKPAENAEEVGQITFHSRFFFLSFPVVGHNKQQQNVQTTYAKTRETKD